MSDAGIDKRPTVTVAALVFDDRGRALFIRTHKWRDRYGLPAGKLDYGESLVEGVVREVREETALRIEGVRFLMVQELIFDRDFFRTDHFVSINFTACCRDAEVVLNDEAQSCLWLEPAAALELDLNRPTRDLVEYYLGMAARDREAPVAA